MFAEKNKRERSKNICLSVCYLYVDDNSSGRTRQIARIFHGANYENVLSLPLVVQTANGFYHPGLWIYAEQFGVPLFDHVCNLLLCIRIIGLELNAFALASRMTTRPEFTLSLPL